MKIGLQTWGSEGDIRPFIALGHGLMKAGHDVKLIYTDAEARSYSEIISRLNLNAVNLPNAVAPSRDFKKELFDRLMSSKKSIDHINTIIKYLLEPTLDEIYRAALALCEESDIIIGHRLIFPIRFAADQRNKPFVSLYLTHRLVVTQYEMPPFIPALGDWEIQLWWWLVRKVLNRLMMPDIKKFAARKNLPRIKDVARDVWFSQRLNLITVSPVLCKPQQNWDRRFQVCGFLGIPENTQHWKIAEDLDRFIDTGAPPVYVTFGSLMPLDEADELHVVSALFGASRLANCRMIIQTSLAGNAEVPTHPDVFYVSKSPHRLVFPRCSVVVHHGAPGTIQTAMLAGCPSIVVAHFLESYSWAKELSRLGVAPNYLDIRTLTAKKLAAKITAVLTNPRLKKNAAMYAASMKDEDGVATAVKSIESAFQS